ncbi:MAG TPA: ABC transporter permease [Actinocrinis sp.]|nr:ABC transporter permease [Actinocrinis sp.]
MLSRARARTRVPTRTADRSALPLRDLLAESLAGLLQRPGRSALTMLGTVLGIGAFVAILGLTATAGGQIDKRFSVLSATAVTVQDVGTAQSAQNAQNSTGISDPISFPPDADHRIEALNGVVSAGIYWPLPLRQPTVSAVPNLSASSAGSAGGSGLSLYAASPGALAAIGPVYSQGLGFNAFHTARKEHVAVLGAAAASRLGITRLDAEPAVFIDGAPYTVVGIISDLRRMPELLLSVIVPDTTALSAYGQPTDQRANMLIETRLGAAQLIARQAALALRPDDPNLFKISAPPDPTTLRDSVTGDFNALFLLLAGITLIIGAVGIANTTLVAVLERTGEIGLRRALGARPRHIAAQFLTESAALGTLGGLIGTSLGTAVVVGTALARQWTAVLEPWTVLPAPLIGTMVGLLAGLYPALRAAYIEPAEALRR